MAMRSCRTWGTWWVHIPVALHRKSDEEQTDSLLAAVDENAAKLITLTPDGPDKNTANDSTTSQTKMNVTSYLSILDIVRALDPLYLVPAFLDGVDKGSNISRHVVQQVHLLRHSVMKSREASWWSGAGLLAFG